MSWRDVPFPISHLTPVAGEVATEKRNLDPLAGRLFFFLMYDSITFMYDKGHVGVGERESENRCWCRGTAMLVSGNSNVGVGEHAMLVSAERCMFMSGLRSTSCQATFCTSRTLCTLRTVYALFARLERRRTGLAEECQAKAKAKTILARSNGVCVKARAKNIYLFTTYSISKPYGLCSRRLSRFVPLSSHCSTGSRFRYAGLDVETSALEVRRPKTKKSYSLYVYLVYLDFAGFMRHERLLRAMLAAILQAYDKRTHTPYTWGWEG